MYNLLIYVKSYKGNLEIKAETSVLVIQPLLSAIYLCTVHENVWFPTDHVSSICSRVIHSLCVS